MHKRIIEKLDQLKLLGVSVSIKNDPDDYLPMIQRARNLVALIKQADSASEDYLLWLKWAKIAVDDLVDELREANAGIALLKRFLNNFKLGYCPVCKQKYQELHYSTDSWVICLIHVTGNNETDRLVREFNLTSSLCYAVSNRVEKNQCVITRDMVIFKPLQNLRGADFDKQCGKRLRHEQRNNQNQNSIP